ncbi:hypothetical protein BDZ45DRAFT_722143 [Acephala macrosclerotiorum]|nr:hypothetical protein BDZ45DRAFT_722143 [Acephala macrosclerotiorum]
MQSSTSDTLPDFTKKCHYTLQLYTCAHKTWLNKPRIKHVWCASSFMCQLLPQASRSPFPSRQFNKLQHSDKNSDKTRCTNMATKPKEIQMKEVCAKCRPVSLGVLKEVRKYERTVGWEEEERVYRVGDECDRENKKDGEVEVEVKRQDEVKKGEDEYNKIVCESGKEVEIGKDAGGNAEAKPDEVLEEVHLWETVKEWPAKEAHERIDISNQVPVADPASPPAAPQPLIARSIFGSFANLLMANGKQEEPKPEDDDDEPFEIWTKVDEDPDWDKIDAKDAKRGMLWKDSGDWVNVNTQ